LLLLLVLPLHALDDLKAARAKYDALAAKVNAGDTDVDWKALRLAARVGEVYGDYDPYDAGKRAQACFEMGDYEGTLRIARETLRHNVADGEAHAAAWSSLKQLGRQPEADKEWSILQALLQSILKSGDGKTAKTAWFVVGLREEFLVLGAQQAQSKEQHSVMQDGHYYSRIVVTDNSGKEAVLWFNIDTDLEMANRAGEGHHIY
jgi:tetratricopeptide (TPR) repeat protein